MRTTLLTFKDKFNAGSIQGSIFTLVMATFGSGILILPYSMMASGLAWGTIQLIVCAWMGYYSLLTVVKCAIKEKVCSYQELAYLTYGGWFRLLVNVVMFLGNLGTVLMYLKLMSTLTINFIISNFAADSSYVSYWTESNTPQQILLAVIAFLLLPLSLTKRLKRLRYLCLMSFLFVVFLCFVVFLQVFSFHPPKQPDLDIKWFVPEGFTDTFPTAVFAFMSHPNILDVFGELRNPRIKRMKKVISVTMILVFLCCLAVGLFGYINFAESPDIFEVDQVGGVILYAYMYNANGVFQGGVPIQVRMCLLMMALALLVTTPINVIPAKDAIKDLFLPRRCDIFGEPLPSGESKMTNFFLVAITIGLAGGIALIPWNNVQAVMNVIGSSFYAMICFIFPAIFYLRLNRLSKMDHSKVLNWLILILMSGFALYMTYHNTMTLIDPESSDTVQ